MFPINLVREVDFRDPEQEVWRLLFTFGLENHDYE